MKRGILWRNWLRFLCCLMCFTRIRCWRVSWVQWGNQCWWMSADDIYIKSNMWKYVIYL